jgi:hypothetical protein
MYYIVLPQIEHGEGSTRALASCRAGPWIEMTLAYIYIFYNCIHKIIYLSIVHLAIYLLIS